MVQPPTFVPFALVVYEFPELTYCSEGLSLQNNRKKMPSSVPIDPARRFNFRSPLCPMGIELVERLDVLRLAQQLCPLGTNSLDIKGPDQ